MRRSLRWSGSILLAFLWALALPAAAHALGLSAPVDVLDTTNVQVSLNSSEGPGLAVLYVDDALVRSLPASQGPRTLTFSAVGLRPGAHRLKAFVRSADGLIWSTTRTITSWRKPGAPALVAPTGRYAGKYTTIVARAGANTTSLKLLLNGAAVATKAAKPGQVVTLAKVTLAAGVNTIVVQGSNPVATTNGTYSIRRLDYPWPTCIVIDKSDYKLYWVRDGVLVKTYPVAIGKASTPTPARNWKVGAKYVYSSWGIYGPRRLRLYKQVGPNSFEYTGYGIHGTNQEWVIGTMASHGCIRMYNRDVLELYPQVPMGTMVQTRE